MTTINRITDKYTHENTSKNNNVNYYVNKKTNSKIMLIHKLCVHVSAYKSSKKFIKTK